MTPYDDYDYTEVYNEIVRAWGEESLQERFEFERRKGKYSYVVKTITSGDMREMEVYPVWYNKADIPRIKKGTSRKEQKNLNNKNAQKEIIRRINANFSDQDILITLNYEDRFIPNEKQARNDIRNYVKKVRDWRRKQGLPKLKYIYVIEYVDAEEYTKDIRIHHHMIMSGMDRDAAEQLWNKGRATECRRLKPDDYGLEGIARYMVKTHKDGEKRWAGSRNLKKPVITKNYTRLTKRKVEKMVNDAVALEETLKFIYKGFRVNDFKSYNSDFVSGYYVYARFRRESIKSKKESKDEEEEAY